MTPNQFLRRVVAARLTLPHGQRPTRDHVEVARLLARWQHPCPPHAKLARAAGVHRNTVGKALARLRGLGLLSWTRQVTRLRGGWIAQVANRYALQSNAGCPAAPISKQIKTLFSCPTKLVHRAKPAVSSDPGDRQRLEEIARKRFAQIHGLSQCAG